MEKLASILLHSQLQAHVYHLRVTGPGSYAAHVALQTYYESIISIIDALVEAYQGKNDLIEFTNVDKLDNNADTKNIIQYFDKIIAAVEKLRTEKDVEDSFIQNEIDNVMMLLYSTRYKLINLQ